jgi:hypothetical protein
MNSELGKKVNKAIEFLSEHPAVSPDSLFGRAISFSIQDVCKRGYDRIVDKMGVDIYPSHKCADRFKDEFDKEYKELEEDYKKYPKNEENIRALKRDKRLVKIDVPYKKLFGESWKYARTEYWGEATFFIYQGKSDYRHWIKDRNPYSWGAYSSHINVTAPSFEELIVKIAERFKERFGNFEADDFLTKKEKQNHKKEEMFFHKKMKKSNYSRLDRNSKYIHVSPAILNHRWAKWFLSTPYGKKTWDSKELREIIK